MKAISSNICQHKAGITSSGYTYSCVRCSNLDIQCSLRQKLAPTKEERKERELTRMMKKYNLVPQQHSVSSKSSDTSTTVMTKSRGKRSSGVGEFSASVPRSSKSMERRQVNDKLSIVMTKSLNNCSSSVGESSTSVDRPTKYIERRFDGPSKNGKSTNVMTNNRGKRPSGTGELSTNIVRPPKCIEEYVNLHNYGTTFEEMAETERLRMELRTTYKRPSDVGVLSASNVRPPKCIEKYVGVHNGGKLVQRVTQTGDVSN